MTGRLEIPNGTLPERLEQLAAIHERNALLCAPASPISRTSAEVAMRHAAIHQRAATDCREAAVILREAGL